MTTTTPDDVRSAPEETVLRPTTCEPPVRIELVATWSTEARPPQPGLFRPGRHWRCSGGSSPDWSGRWRARRALPPGSPSSTTANPDSSDPRRAFFSHPRHPEANGAQWKSLPHAFSR